MVKKSLNREIVARLSVKKPFKVILFATMSSPGEFVQSMNGMTLLDAISMRLQVIGESVREIQKVALSYLKESYGIDWDRIARFRDFVSHHYDQIDHEIVFDICKMHIPSLKTAIQDI
jgi:uncharacterized protein with HEPN domain